MSIEESFEEFGELKYVFYLVIGIAVILIIRIPFVGLLTFPVGPIAEFCEFVEIGLGEGATMAADLLVDVTIILIVIWVGRSTLPIMVLIMRFIQIGTQMIIERMKETENE